LHVLIVHIVKPGIAAGPGAEGIEFIASAENTHFLLFIGVIRRILRGADFIPQLTTPF